MSKCRIIGSNYGAQIVLHFFSWAFYIFNLSIFKFKIIHILCNSMLLNILEQIPA